MDSGQGSNKILDLANTDLSGVDVTGGGIGGSAVASGALRPGSAGREGLRRGNRPECCFGHAEQANLIARCGGNDLGHVGTCLV